MPRHPPDPDVLGTLFGALGAKHRRNPAPANDDVVPAERTRNLRIRLQRDDLTFYASRIGKIVRVVQRVKFAAGEANRAIHRGGLARIRLMENADPRIVEILD